ncbi:hypothetical protein SteCoe_27629 [Stentor coeruleus]|uniref:Uncharacterized protein n=1 Tax=Stentor coeruleus TaxID=5963 RepID=A0A1R2BA42_9CILI|nr:hypothetical protein SteCoe_27629 [Stentor coeruleus]
MIQDKLTESFATIKKIEKEISAQREKLRQIRADLIIQQKSLEKNLDPHLVSLHNENSLLRQEKLEMLNFRNKLTLEAIRDKDLKLYNLIKKFQSAESLHLSLKSSLLTLDDTRKAFLEKYSIITQNLQIEDKLKARAKELEKQCEARITSIEKLKACLYTKKKTLCNPGKEEDEIAHLMGVYEGLVKQKLDLVDENERIMLEIQHTTEEIKDYQSSPHNKSTIITRVKETIEENEGDVKKIEEKIREKMIKFKELKEKCDELRKAIKTYRAKSRDNSFCSTKRYMPRKIEEGNSFESLTSPKEGSGRAVAAKKIIEFNRSHFIKKKTMFV